MNESFLAACGVPYHCMTLTGRKREFLTELPPDDRSRNAAIPDAALVFTRRDAIRLSLAAGAGLGMVGVARQEAQAGFWSFVGGALFSAGLGWLVGRVLDRAFPSTSQELGLRQVASPRPSRSSDFHNRYAEPYEVTNQRVWLPVRRVVRFDCDFGLDYYLRAFDLNGVELRQIQREEQYYESSMLPIDLRATYNPTYHERKLNAVKRAYDIDISPSDISYVQTVRDEKKHEHIGFGVRRGEKAQFLMG